MGITLSTSSAAVKKNVNDAYLPEGRVTEHPAKVPQGCYWRLNIYI